MLDHNNEALKRCNKLLLGHILKKRCKCAEKFDRLVFANLWGVWAGLGLDESFEGCKENLTVTLTLSVDKSNGWFIGVLLDVTIRVMWYVVNEVCEDLIKVTGLKEVCYLADDLAARDTIGALIRNQAASDFEILWRIFVSRCDS